MVIHLPLGGGAGRAYTADDDLPELLPMDLEEGPQRGVRGIGVTVSLAPDPVVREESQEGRLVDIAPVPFRLEGRDRLRRAGQQPGGILAGCARRSKPVPGDDAEVATAPASMPPPEVAMRVGRLPGRHHAARDRKSTRLTPVTATSRI